MRFLAEGLSVTPTGDRNQESQSRLHESMGSTEKDESVRMPGISAPVAFIAPLRVHTMRVEGQHWWPFHEEHLAAVSQPKPVRTTLMHIFVQHHVPYCFLLANQAIRRPQTLHGTPDNYIPPARFNKAPRQKGRMSRLHESLARQVFVRPAVEHVPLSILIFLILFGVPLFLIQGIFNLRV